MQGIPPFKPTLSAVEDDSFDNWVHGQRALYQKYLDTYGRTMRKAIEEGQEICVISIRYKLYGCNSTDLPPSSVSQKLAVQQFIAGLIGLGYPHEKKIKSKQLPRDFENNIDYTNEEVIVIKLK